MQKQAPRPAPASFWSLPRAVLASGPESSTLVVAAGFLEHFSQIAVFSPGRFQIENEILDRQTQVIEAFLKAADGGPQALVALAGFVGELFELPALRDGQG